MPALLLKILSGIHLGAEVELSASELTLGRGPACDLILDDRLLAEQHVVLFAPAGQARIRFLAPGHLGLEAQAVGTEITLPPGEIVTIGATQFCVGPLDSAWPELKLPAWRQLHEAAPGTSSSVEGASAQQKNALSETDSETRLNNPDKDAPSAANEQAPADGLAPVAADGEASAHRNRRRGTWAVLVSLTIIIILVAAFCWSLPKIDKILPENQGAVSDTAAPGLAAAKRIKILQEICNQHHLTLNQSEGQLKISGLVETNEELAVIEKAALAVDTPPEIEVFSRPQMQMAADAVIRGFGYPVKAEIKEQGLLALRGTAPSPADWTRVLVRLQEDVPGVRRFESKIEFVSQI